MTIQDVSLPVTRYNKNMKGWSNQSKIVLSVGLVTIVVGGGVAAFYKIKRDRAFEIPLIVESTPSSMPSDDIFTSLPIATSSPKPTLSTLPEKASVDVPFLVQAPLANWDALHEESCEEASLIMVRHFLDKTKLGSAEDIDKEITDLVSYEGQNGYKVDVTVSELGEIGRKYYHLSNPRVGKNITINDIKREIAEGRPVIIPAAGKMLPNPYFTGGGPKYHMLVITGYDSKGFITNDPGTRRGHDFRYNYEDLYKAIHDWDEDNILNGPKNYLVFDD
jgi:uncharacterized protein YvpB